MNAPPQHHDPARQLAAIVESSDDAILTKDLDGIITSWNRGAERLFGYGPDEMIGRSITLLMPADRVAEEADILRRIRAGERVDHYETVRRRKDGSLIDISLSISPLKDRGGAVVGASKIARDITARKRIERELEAARESLRHYNEKLESRVAERTAELREAVAHLEEFSYSMSHDLRSPVRAIHGYARVLLEDYGSRLDDEGRDHLRRIMRAGERMDALIRDLLAFSQISYARVKPAEVSLDRLVPDLLRERQGIPGAKIEVQRPLPSVVAHEPTLACVIGNLIDNACKFVRPGEPPWVTIWGEATGDRARLYIEDRGIGIRPEHQTRLFGLFERLHPSAAYEGTGMGLAIVKKGLERMNGEAGVQSDGKTGSRFWIELPRVAA